MKFEELISPKDAVLSFNDSPTVQFEENKRKYIGENKQKKKILRLRVDGKLVDSSEEKCDFSAIIPQGPTDSGSTDSIKKAFSESICILVEIKGSDISKAASQILNTITFFQQEYGIKRFAGRIVATKCKTTELNAPEYKTLDRKLKSINQKYQIPYKTLDKKNNILKEQL